MFKQLFDHFTQTTFSSWEDSSYNTKGNQSDREVVDEMKSKINEVVSKGFVYRQVFINKSICGQLRGDERHPLFDQPITDTTHWYALIQAVTEMGFYFTVVSPTLWKQVLLVDQRQIPLRYIQNEWSNNQDWSVN